MLLMVPSFNISSWVDTKGTQRFQRKCASSPYFFSRRRIVSRRPTFFPAEKYGGTRLIPKCRYCAYYRTFPRTYGSARLTKGRWSTWYHVEPWTCNADSLIFNGLSIFSPAYVAREGVGSSPVKARLDIKVAIYKEPARVSARAARISSIIRIFMHTRVHVYIHTRTRRRTRRRRAKEDTRRDRSAVFAYRER